jgi:hypothetical protein
LLGDFLLMPVESAGEGEEQLPGLRDWLHVSPDAVWSVEASGIIGGPSTAESSVVAVSRKSCGSEDLGFG